MATIRAAVRTRTPHHNQHASPKGSITASMPRAVDGPLGSPLVPGSSECSASLTTHALQLCACISHATSPSGIMGCNGPQASVVEDTLPRTFTIARRRKHWGRPACATSKLYVHSPCSMQKMLTEGCRDGLPAMAFFQGCAEHHWSQMR